MRLLLEVGYTKVLLQESADVAAVIRALAEAVVVVEKNKSNYSDPTHYVVNRDASLSVPEFISDSQLVSEDEAAEMDIETLTKRNATLEKERREVTAKLKALEEKVDALTSGDG